MENTGNLWTTCTKNDFTIEFVIRRAIWRRSGRWTLLYCSFWPKLLENGSIQLHQGYGGKEEIQQISDVIHYLMANPAERLDMHEASRRCGLSYYAFSRFFHEMTGMGYAEYGNLIRIRHTEELLIYSDMSVEEISRAVGMSSANYYTRLFKKVNGMSPTKYRSVYGKRQY